MLTALTYIIAVAVGFVIGALVVNNNNAKSKAIIENLETKLNETIDKLNKK